MANWICAFPSLKPRPLSSVHRVNLHATSPTFFRPTTRNTAELPFKAITNTIRVMWSHNGSNVGHAIASGAQKGKHRSFLSSAHSPNSLPLKTVDQQNAEQNPRPSQG
jgi:hypothetical protein